MTYVMSNTTQWSTINKSLMWRTYRRRLAWLIDFPSSAELIELSSTNPNRVFLLSVL